MNKLIYGLLASMFVLTACFEDEGNYDYNVTNPPHWLVDYTQPTYFVGYQDSEVVLNGAPLFTWDTDSLQRSEEVTYEWIVNGKTVAEGIKVTMKTEELMEKADKKRSSYYNYYSYKTWGAAATYHLCIDSSVLGIDGTVEFIKQFVKLKLQLP